jgi:hypothetical protein
MNFAELIEKNSYFVDKTQYIEKLEKYQNPVFYHTRRRYEADFGICRGAQI